MPVCSTCGREKSEEAASRGVVRLVHLFAYYARLLRKETKPNELTSLENNIIVMEILDAARQSA